MQVDETKLLKKIEKWRLKRAEAVELGNGPAALRGEVTMLFHAVPRNSLRRFPVTESWLMTEQEIRHLYVPHQATHRRYNADGFLGTAQIGNDAGAFGYTQLFRSGIVEYADSNCFRSPTAGCDPMILGQELEQHIVNCYQDVVDRGRRLAQTDTVYIGISLVGIAGKAFFSTISGLEFQRSGGTDRNIFISPEVLADIKEPEDVPYTTTLLPLVDTMWQVGGLAQTPFRRKSDWRPFEERR